MDIEVLIWLLITVAVAFSLLLVQLFKRVGALEKVVARLNRQLNSAAREIRALKVATAATPSATTVASTSAQPPSVTTRRADEIPAPRATSSSLTPADVTQAAPSASVAETVSPSKSTPSPKAVDDSATSSHAYDWAYTSDQQTTGEHVGSRAWDAIALGALKRWFTQGNVPVKIGMLVLFAGLTALMKYASDQGWLAFPIELRLAGIGTAALGGLVFAWHQRQRNRGFALSLQGGMIGILLLLVFAAYKYYGLLTAEGAFAVSIILVAGAAALAVLQNAIALVVFAILAGFLAPLWLSTGSGSPTALFGYYAVLNSGIFAIAWFKPWRALNLMGFFFTFGVGTAWGVLDYTPAHYASAQPFLVLFFLFYLALPILYAWRTPAQQRDVIDGSLVFGTPLIAFSLQACLMTEQLLVLALCALGLALLYLGLCGYLGRYQRFKALTYGYALLAIGFATLAVPLALSARATAAIFALEGAGLVMLGLYQQRLIPQGVGAALQFVAAVTLVYHGTATIDSRPEVEDGLAGVLLAFAAWVSAASWWRIKRHEAAGVAYLWGLLCWCVTGGVLLNYFMPPRLLIDGWLLFIGVTGALAAEVYRYRAAPLLSATLLASFGGLFFLAGAGTLIDAWFAWQGSHWGGLLVTWLIIAVLGGRSLISLRANPGAIACAAQFCWWLLWIWVPSLWLTEYIRHLGLAWSWYHVGWGVPALVLAILSVTQPDKLTYPLGPRFNTSLPALQITVFALLLWWWLLALPLSGDDAPLSWCLVINPLDLCQMAVVVAIALWGRTKSSPAVLREMRAPLLVTMVFSLISVMALRSTHHWGQIPWDSELLTHSLAQTSLTLVWSILGVMGWIIGSRRRQHALWLASAVLMGVVLAKLVGIDRHHLGDLWGIVSFIAYGLLCTVVGFFAPMPPRRPKQPNEVSS